MTKSKGYTLWTNEKGETMNIPNVLNAKIREMIRQYETSLEGGDKYVTSEKIIYHCIKQKDIDQFFYKSK